MKTISIIVLFTLFFTACSSSDEKPEPEVNRLVLDLGTTTAFRGQISVNVRANDNLPASEILRDFFYYVFDENGKTVAAKDGQVCRTYTRAELLAANNHIEEELPEGRYTIVMLGLGDMNYAGSEDLQTLTKYADPWIKTEVTEQLPVRGEYFYAQNSVIIPGEKPSTVELKRKVGRVEIDLNVEDEHLKSRIQEIGIQYKSDYIYSQMNALGTFIGITGQLTAYVNEDLSKDLYFYSLPSFKMNDVPGHVLVTVLMDSGNQKVYRFPFSNAAILENGKTIIHLTLIPAPGESTNLSIHGTLKIDYSWGEDINIDVEG